jgi:hypothetical protein
MQKQIATQKTLAMTGLIVPVSSIPFVPVSDRACLLTEGLQLM